MNLPNNKQINHSLFLANVTPLQILHGVNVRLQNGKLTEPEGEVAAAAGIVTRLSTRGVLLLVLYVRNGFN